MHGSPELYFSTAVYISRFANKRTNLMYRIGRANDKFVVELSIWVYLSGNNKRHLNADG